MSLIHDKRFPNESDAYRDRRDALLRAEMSLRRELEKVAALRRALPEGGALKENYEFDSADGPVRFSELFAPGHDTLLAYNFMYPPAGRPCPACTAFLDSLNANARHLGERISIAVIGKAPAAALQRWADARGWGELPLLSSGGNTYNADYFAEAPDGSQLPLINIFTRTGDAGIVHRYCSELFFAPAEDGQHPRHIDLAWPLWAVLDMTPGGRPDNWFPTDSYEETLAACGIG